MKVGLYQRMSDYYSEYGFTKYSEHGGWYTNTWFTLLEQEGWGDGPLSKQDFHKYVLPEEFYQ